ncbi:MAG: leucine--tRNA ligase [Chitinophagales bacterium]
MDYSIERIKEIEEKWKKSWEATSLYKVVEDTARPKYYVLDMFPYPSGSGLHVGHPLGYVASDIVSRYKRLKGFNVLHPMGFDAFGLPAEQYAIETGQHPAIITEKNINYYREQLNKMGFSFDWSREVKTSDPKFYKWTQWIFMQLFKCWFNPFTNKAEYIESLITILEKEGSKKLFDADRSEKNISADDWRNYAEEEKQRFLMQFRLAYLDHAMVWWCEALGTVLANDEVKEGLSERGGHPVEKIRMRQWFLRITNYAERLLEGLEKVDFSESMKEMQRNWIGKSEGAVVEFRIAPARPRQSDGDWELRNEGAQNTIAIFTTRPDTIYGATFMVLAPEHEMVEKITTPEFKTEVEKYIQYVKSRSERDRISEVKKVTGQFTGAFAINPFTEKQIPVYIAEYVLAGYGTGAIMAVPGNDDRDFAFATKFDLDIVEVIDQSDHPNATREDKIGKLINSEILNGLEVKDAIQKILSEIETRKIGKRKINYRLRDAGYSRQRYWGEPFPVYYKNEIPYLIDDREIPLLLPEVESYKPEGAAKSPLASLKEWMNYQSPFDENKKGMRETDTMPGYAGSSWYFYRYMDVNNENEFASREKINYWKNVDLYIGGTEHAVGHLLYSRLWNKFLFDIGLVVEDEPYKKLVNQGMIQGISRIVYRVNGSNLFVSRSEKDKYDVTELRVEHRFVNNEELDIERFKKSREDFNNAEFILEDEKYITGSEVEKMSKRYGNVVNPDEVIEEFGADCFRMYEMFLGPLDASKPWDTKGITGVQGFLRKLWRLFIDETGNLKLTDATASNDEMKVLHKTIKKVGEDIEKLSFNTAVSAFMICVNELSALKCDKKEILENLLIILAPFAPFITEELWESCGHAGSIHKAAWPQINDAYLIENTFNYPVSINGKTRDTIELSLDMPTGEIEKTVMALESVIKWTEGKTPKKIIIVKGKIVNVVI